MMSNNKDKYAFAVSRKLKDKKLPKGNEYEEVIARYVKGRG